MDKYEYKLKLDQMRSLTAEGNYKTAAEIADSINWHKIKNVNALMKAGEIYENTGRYEESREILLMAYDRSPIGRMIIYRLAEVAIQMGSLDEAAEYYQEFLEIAPHDNLRYVLKYKLSKAQGADLAAQISILEELKEQEYSEEWAYELACLYHKAGMAEKCVDACDELILWFGDGPYVERALELKMAHQPLNRQQEDKYRQFRQKKEGIVEVRPDDMLESGEIVNQTVQIPNLNLTPERFNTQNLQEELQKNMKQIMEATEKEELDDSIDNIKKLVEEIPYLQLPKDDIATAATKRFPHIETDAEINDSIKSNFKELLAEERDGQMSLNVPQYSVAEQQVQGQMSIEDVLYDWEKTRRAAETVLQEADQRKLESAKARALQEAEDIMERLVDVIPKLDSGFTPKDLLEEQYLGGQPLAQDQAAQMVANMNQILQQEIDRLSTENAQMDEQLAAAAAEPEMQMPVEAEEEPIPQQEEETEETEDIYSSAEAFAAAIMSGVEGLEIAEEDAAEAFEPEGIPNPEPRMALDLEPDMAADLEPEGISELEEEVAHISPKTAEQANEPRFLEKESDLEAANAYDTYDAYDASEVESAVNADTEMPLPEIAMPEDLAVAPETKEGRERLPDIREPDEEDIRPVIKKLSKEQKEIFSYFVPIKGMEQQLCQALTGISQHFQETEPLPRGNLIIQGGQGSGKTVLATNMIKVLQKETGKPDGRIGKIEAAALNKKDLVTLFGKVAGGCLIIEHAGDITRETAIRISQLLGSSEQSAFLILEDTRKGIEAALGRDAAFAACFTEKITIPVFTSDELVAFAKSYANELGYSIDEMGVLALYNSISNIQRLDQATTLAEVKDIVDGAIGKVESGTIRKAFSIITSRRYDAEDYVILHEKDFGF